MLVKKIDFQFIQKSYELRKLTYGPRKNFDKNIFFLKMDKIAQKMFRIMKIDVCEIFVKSERNFFFIENSEIRPDSETLTRIHENQLI